MEERGGWEDGGKGRVGGWREGEGGRMEGGKDEGRMREGIVGGGREGRVGMRGERVGRLNIS